MKIILTTDLNINIVKHVDDDCLAEDNELFQVLNQLNAKADVFICPVCKSSIKLQENSLLCEKNHCFDITKKGYFTLLRKNKSRNDVTCKMTNNKFKKIAYKLSFIF